MRFCSISGYFFQLELDCFYFPVVYEVCVKINNIERDNKVVSLIVFVMCSSTSKPPFINILMKLFLLDIILNLFVIQ